MFLEMENQNQEMSNVFKIKIDSALINGEQNGSGKPVVFLHAGVADRRMWRPQIDVLQNTHHTVAYDMRGFGETTSPDEPYTNVQDLKQLLEQLELQKVILVGCSQGGRLAIDFSLAYPDQVEKLVLIAPAVSGAPAPETFPAVIEKKLDALDEADENDDLDQINEIEAQLWLDGPASEAGRVSGPLRDLFLDMNGIALNMPDLDQEIDPPSAYEQVSQLTQPTLVLWGDLDFPHVQDRCRYLVDSIPNATGQEISGTAHLPNLEQPELVNQLLADFI